MRCCSLCSQQSYIIIYSCCSAQAAPSINPNIFEHVCRNSRETLQFITMPTKLLEAANTTPQIITRDGIVIKRKPDLLFALIIILSFGVFVSSYAAGLF